MTIIAIVSQKGGSGKTTLSVNLAAAAEAAGAVALIIDTDPQATASQWGAWRSDKAPEVIDSAPPRILAKVEAAKAQGATFIVIDTPPHADSAASRAVEVADLVLEAGGVGVALGVLLAGAGGNGPVMNLIPTDGDPGSVRIDPWRVVHRLNRQAARALAGAGGDGNRHVLAVGAGAVGSNVIDIASRSGVATWTIVDDDVVLPHNTVRRVACVDYSVAKGGPLAAYRFDGDAELSASKFIAV
jgi:hypothetical protein